MIKSLALLPVTLVVLLLTSPQAAEGKAYYAHKKEMVSRAIAIAVVKVTEVEAVDVKGKHWTYRQRATAKVEQVLKGELPKDVTLFGQETFICAQCDSPVGTHLVFLRKDGDKWVGSNWHLSVRPITDDKVEWYADDKSMKLEAAPLKDVIAEVKGFVEADAKKEKAPVS